MATGVTGFRYWRHVTLGRARQPARMTVTRPDGSSYDLRKSLGLPAVPAALDPLADDAPGWHSWP
jgi:hypothetical protein